MYNKYYIIIIAFTLLFSCSREISIVGTIRITENDIDQRAKVSNIYYPGSGKRYVGLSQLIKGNLSLVILESLGQKVEDSVLVSEAQRIDRNTKAPAVLKRIKDVYGKDREAYLNNFVRLVYAERVLYAAVFLNSKEIHKDQFQKAQAFLNNVTVSPGSFMENANNTGAIGSRLLVSTKFGILPYKQEKQRNDPGKGGAMEEAERISGLLSNILPGKVVSEIVDWPESFQVIRFIRKDGKDYRIESATFPKKSYDDWFWERAAKIPVIIKEKQLQEDLLKEVSWAKKLKLE